MGLFGSELGFGNWRELRGWVEGGICPLCRIEKNSIRRLLKYSGTWREQFLETTWLRLNEDLVQNFPDLT